MQDVEQLGPLRHLLQRPPLLQCRYIDNVTSNFAKKNFNIINFVKIFSEVCLFRCLLFWGLSHLTFDVRGLYFSDVFRSYFCRSDVCRCTETKVVPTRAGHRLYYSHLANVWAICCSFPLSHISRKDSRLAPSQSWWDFPFYTQICLVFVYWFSELGTRQHCRDNGGMFSGQKMVVCYIMSIFVVATPFRHQGRNICHIVLDT